MNVDVQVASLTIEVEIRIEDLYSNMKLNKTDNVLLSLNFEIEQCSTGLSLVLEPTCLFTCSTVDDVPTLYGCKL